VKSLAADRSPVQLPRARSLDSVARRRLYPFTNTKPVASHVCLHTQNTKEKPAPKRRSFPSSGLRVTDMPVRMCTSEQLMKVAKQRPLWLQKPVENVSGHRAPRSARFQPCVQTPNTNLRA
jgi:hypothetical protein